MRCAPLVDRLSLAVPALAVAAYFVWPPYDTGPANSLVAVVTSWILLLLLFFWRLRAHPSPRSSRVDGIYLLYQGAAYLVLVAAAVWYFSAPYSHPASWLIFAVSTLAPPALSLARRLIDVRLEQARFRSQLLLLLVSSCLSLGLFEIAHERIFPHDIFEDRIAVNSDDRTYWYIVSSPAPDGSNRANSYGFLGPEPPRRPKALQIVVLGDSIPAAGRAVNFPAVAESLLQDPALPPVEVTNASIEGFSTEQIHRFYTERLAGLSHDVVVLSFYMDDVNRELRYRKDNWLYTPSWPEWMQDVYHGCASCRIVLNARGFDEAAFLLYRRRSIEEALPAALALLDELDRAARARGAALAVFNVPVFRWNGVLKDPGDYEYAELNSQVQQWCGKRGIRYRDILPDLVGKDIAPLKISSLDNHFNDQGHREVGLLLAEFLEDILRRAEPRRATTF